MKVVLFAVIGDRCGDRFRNNLSPPETSMNKAFDYWPVIGDRGMCIFI
jgi:hypothetical protein